MSAESPMLVGDMGEVFRGSEGKWRDKGEGDS